MLKKRKIGRKIATLLVLAAAGWFFTTRNTASESENVQEITYLVPEIHHSCPACNGQKVHYTIKSVTFTIEIKEE